MQALGLFAQGIEHCRGHGKTIVSRGGACFSTQKKEETFWNDFFSRDEGELFAAHVADGPNVQSRARNIAAQHLRQRCEPVQASICGISSSLRDFISSHQSAQRSFLP